MRLTIQTPHPNIKDTDKSGDSLDHLDFPEFILGLFNFCLLPSGLLAPYLFSLYDTDDSGKIGVHELEIMVKELFPPASYKKSLSNLKHTLVAKNPNGEITETEFVEAEKHAQSILMPLSNLQFSLRKQTLGIIWWDWLQRKVYHRISEERVGNVYELMEKFRDDERKQKEVEHLAMEAVAAAETQRLQEEEEQREEENVRRAEEGYGWIPHNASVGFLDRPPAIQGQIHF